MALLDTCHELVDLGGGQFRLTAHIRQVAYRHAGSLHRIATTWANSGIPGRPHIVTASQLMTSAGNDGTRRIHPTRDENVYLELGAPFVKIGDWTQVTLGTPDRNRNFLRWTTTSANLYVAHGGHFIKLGILLKNGWQPEDGLIAFPFALSGLTWQAGNLLAQGVPVMRLRPPLVYDLDDPETTRPVNWSFHEISGQQYALLTLPDLTGISRPLVDPTFETQPDGTAGQDTQLSTSNQDKHYGSDDEMLVDTSGSTRCSLIKFDVSSIPSGATCDSATLYLYNKITAISNRSDTVHEILAANDGWLEGATADPGYGLAVYDHHTEESSGGASDEQDWAGSAGCNTADTDYDSTSLGTITYNANDEAGTESSCSLTAAAIEDWFAPTNENYGLALRGQYMGWCTSDHATAGYRPKLVVEYTAAAAAAALPVISAQEIHSLVFGGVTVR